jgi:hypothetical protein
MLRRVTYTFVVTMALLGGLILPSAPPAPATIVGRCSIITPSTVTITKPYTLITATLGADCAANYEAYASWNVRHSYYGPNNIFIFDGTRSDSIGLYDWEHYGTYYVEPGFAWDSAYNDLSQNTRSYVVKSGSLLSFWATRAGSYVTLRAYNVYYNTNASAYLPWGNHQIFLQYKACSTCAWTSLRNVSTGSNGVANFRFYAPRTRYYRALAYGNALVWGTTSGVALR